MSKSSFRLFHEDTLTVTPTPGIQALVFDPSTHTYSFNMSGNTKIGRIASWSTLMGSYTYVGLNGILNGITGTCRNCLSCMCHCYVRSSYRYPSVVFSQAVNTWGLRHAIKKVERDLSNQIAEHNLKIIRINQSGELENDRQMALWCRLAIKFPETRFYLYTKMYDIVGKFLENGDVPPNLTVLFSVWHEVGVAEYKKYAHLPNVKAFVYDDGKNMRLRTKIYCPAYKKVVKKDPFGNIIRVGNKAVMDHSITCEKCRLCIDSKAKVIACHDH